MSLTLRSSKGSELTHAEGDANFSGLANGSLITALDDAVVNVQLTATGSVATTQHEVNNRQAWAEDFGAVGDGVTNDRAAIALADAAVSCIRFKYGKTYLVSTSLTIAAVCYFEPGAKISIAGGQTITFSGKVISLGGDPTTGAGTTTYSHTVNIFANSLGFGMGKAPSTNADDFVHIHQDVNNSSGVLIVNDDTGALAEGFIHIYGGPRSGGSTGSGVRISANSAAGGALVDIVFHDNLTASIIQQAAQPLDFYVNNLRMMQFISTASTVNYHTFKGGAAASSVIQSCAGSDTDISIVVDTKGAGSFFVRTADGASNQFEVSHTASASRRVVVTGSNGGNPTITTSAGNLAITPAVIVAATSGTAIGIATSSTTALNLPAGTTGISNIRLAHGSAPSSPVDGDMWTTTAGLFVRVNGVTVGPLS